MKSSFPLFPDSASALSTDVDALFIVWSLISIFFTVLIAGLIIVLMARYRRKHAEEVGANEEMPVWIEILWSAVPLAIMLVMFAWGARVFFELYRPPADAIEFTAIGKQWMWKIQHPEGQREINALHVPVGQAIKMKIASEDVIHSFYIPAFRIKQDAVPGRYTSIWFKATKVGHLSPVLRRVLRHRALADDRQRHRHGAEGLRELAGRRHPGQVDGRLRRRPLHLARLRHLPPGRRPASCSADRSSKGSSAARSSSPTAAR